MVLASIQVLVDPERLHEADRLLLDCERRLRVGGRCRQWIVTQTGTGQYTSMCFYDSERDAHDAIGEVVQCMRSFGSLVSYFAHRVVNDVVLDRRF